MNKYYTRACNFYYGALSKKYIKKKKSIPLNGYNQISFDKLEIIDRKKNKIINVKDISKLSTTLKKNDVKRWLFSESPYPIAFTFDNAFDNTFRDFPDNASEAWEA